MFIHLCSFFQCLLTLVWTSAPPCCLLQSVLLLCSYVFCSFTEASFLYFCDVIYVHLLLKFHFYASFIWFLCFCYWRCVLQLVFICVFSDLHLYFLLLHSYVFYSFIAVVAKCVFCRWFLSYLWLLCIMFWLCWSIDYTTINSLLLLCVVYLLFCSIMFLCLATLLSISVSLLMLCYSPSSYLVLLLRVFTSSCTVSTYISVMLVVMWCPC